MVPRYDRRSIFYLWSIKSILKMLRLTKTNLAQQYWIYFHRRNKFLPFIHYCSNSFHVLWSCFITRWLHRTRNTTLKVTVYLGFSELFYVGVALVGSYTLETNLHANTGREPSVPPYTCVVEKLLQKLALQTLNGATWNHRDHSEDQSWSKTC